MKKTKHRILAFMLCAVMLFSAAGPVGPVLADELGGDAGYVDDTGLVQDEGAADMADSAGDDAGDLVGSDPTGDGDAGNLDGSDPTGDGDAGNLDGGDPAGDGAAGDLEGGDPAGEDLGASGNGQGGAQDGDPAPSDGGDVSVPTEDTGAAYEALRAAYDGFYEIYLSESSEHGSDGHACRFGSFEAVYAMARDILDMAAAAGGDSGIESDVKRILSECALSAYGTRVSAMLDTDFSDLPAFDAALQDCREFRYDGSVMDMRNLIAGSDRSGLAEIEAMADAARGALSGAGNGNLSGDDQFGQDPGPAVPADPDPAVPGDSGSAISEAGQAFLDGLAAVEAACAAGSYYAWADFMLAVDDLYAVLENGTEADFSDAGVMQGMSSLAALVSSEAVKELGRMAAAMRRDIDSGAYWNMARPLEELDDTVAAAKSLLEYMTDSDRAACAGIISDIDAMRAEFAGTEADPGQPEPSDQAKSFKASFESFIRNCTDFSDGSYDPDNWAGTVGDFDDLLAQRDSVKRQGAAVDAAELDAIGLSDYADRADAGISGAAVYMFSNAVRYVEHLYDGIHGGMADNEAVRKAVDNANRFLSYMTSVDKGSLLVSSGLHILDNIEVELDGGGSEMTDAQKAFLVRFEDWKASYEPYVGYQTLVFGRDGLFTDSYDYDTTAYSEFAALWYEASRLDQSGRMLLQSASETRGLTQAISNAVMPVEVRNAALFMAKAAGNEARHSFLTDGRKTFDDVKSAYERGDLSFDDACQRLDMFLFPYTHSLRFVVRRGQAELRAMSLTRYWYFDSGFSFIPEMTGMYVPDQPVSDVRALYEEMFVFMNSQTEVVDPGDIDMSAFSDIAKAYFAAYREFCEKASRGLFDAIPFRFMYEESYVEALRSGIPQEELSSAEFNVACMLLVEEATNGQGLHFNGPHDAYRNLFNNVDMNSRHLFDEFFQLAYAVLLEDLAADEVSSAKSRLVGLYTMIAQNGYLHIMAYPECADVLEKLDLDLEGPLSDEGKAYLAMVASINEKIADGGYDNRLFRFWYDLNNLSVAYMAVPGADKINPLFVEQSKIDDHKTDILLGQLDADMARFIADGVFTDLDLMNFIRVAYTVIDSGSIGPDSSVLYDFVVKASGTQLDEYPEYVEIKTALQALGLDLDDSLAVMYDVAWVTGGHTKAGADSAHGVLDFTEQSSWQDIMNANTAELQVSISSLRTVKPGNLRISLPYRLSADPGTAGMSGNAPGPYIDVSTVNSFIDAWPEFEIVSNEFGSDYFTITNAVELTGSTMSFRLPYSYDCRIAIGDGEFNGEMSISTGISRPENVLFSLSYAADVFSVNVYRSSWSYSGVTNNHYRRLRSWSPAVEAAYGLSEDEFNDAVRDNANMFVEFIFDTMAESTDIVQSLRYGIDLSNNGRIVGLWDGNVPIGVSANILDSADGIQFDFAYGAIQNGNSSYYRTLSSYNTRAYGNYTYLRGIRPTDDARDNNNRGPVHVLAEFPVADLVVQTDGNVTVSAKVTPYAECMRKSEPVVGQSIDITVTEPFGWINGGDGQYGVNSGHYGSRVDVDGFMLRNGVGVPSRNMYFVGTYTDPGYLPVSAAETEFHRAELIADMFVVPDTSGGYVMLGESDYTVKSFDVGFGNGVAYLDDHRGFTGWREKFTREDTGDANLQVYVKTPASNGQWVFDGSVVLSDSSFSVDSSKMDYYSYTVNAEDAYAVKLSYDHIYGNYFCMLMEPTIMFHADSENILSIIDDVAAYGNSDIEARFMGGLVVFGRDGSWLNSVSNSWLSYGGGNTVRAHDREAYSDFVTDEKAIQRVAVSGTCFKDSSDKVSVSTSLCASDAFGHSVSTTRAMMSAENVTWIPNKMTLSVSPYAGMFSRDDPSSAVSVADAYRAIMVSDGAHPIYKCRSVEFNILVPSVLDVVAVREGIDRNTMYVHNTGYSHDGGYEWVDTPFEIESYDINDSLNGDYSLLTVRIKSDVDPLARAMWAMTSSGNGTGWGGAILFGGIRVDCVPKTDRFKSGDYKFLVDVSFLDSADNVIDLSSYIGRDAVSNDGYYAGNDFGDIAWLYDSNGNGDAETPEVVYGRVGMSLNGAAAMSNMLISVQGDSAPAWGQSDTLSPGIDYRYRLGYGATVTQATDVVMFCSIEEGQPFQGVLRDIDMSDLDRRGIAYKLWASESNVDSGLYVESVWTEDMLASSGDWLLVDDLADYDYSGVRSIAVSFGDYVFLPAEPGSVKDNFVYVYLGMAFPETGLATMATEINNRAFYSSRTGEGADLPVMSGVTDSVTLKLNRDVGSIMRKTVGAGHMSFTDHSYTVIWVDGYTGTTISSGVVNDSGVMPAYPDAPDHSADGYVFKNWSAPVRDSSGNVVITAQYTPDFNHAAPGFSSVIVTYTDGTDEHVFPDYSVEGLRQGDLMPEFPLGRPQRKGYEFMGWSPAVNPIVDFEDADDNGDIIYTATWQKKLSANYTVRFVDTDGNAIKGSEIRSDTVGSTVSVSNMDKVVSGYMYVPDGSTESALLKASGTVLTLRFAKLIWVTWLSEDGTSINSEQLLAGYDYSDLYPNDRDTTGRWGDPETDADGNITIRWQIVDPDDITDPDVPL